MGVVGWLCQSYYWQPTYNALYRSLTLQRVVNKRACHWLHSTTRCSIITTRCRLHSTSTTAFHIVTINTLSINAKYHHTPRARARVCACHYRQVLDDTMMKDHQAASENLDDSNDLGSPCRCSAIARGSSSTCAYNPHPLTAMTVRGHSKICHAWRGRRSDGVWQSVTGAGGVLHCVMWRRGIFL